MRLHQLGIPIRVRIDAAGRPLAFTHEGQTHPVSTIEEVREPHLDWWSPAGEAHRVYHLVTTPQGMVCEIYEDRARLGDREASEARIGGAWFLARVYD